jgi:hypothetical protein
MDRLRGLRQGLRRQARNAWACEHQRQAVPLHRRADQRHEPSRWPTAFQGREDRPRSRSALTRQVVAHYLLACILPFVTPCGCPYRAGRFATDASRFHLRCPTGYRECVVSRASTARDRTRWASFANAPGMCSIVSRQQHRRPACSTTSRPFPFTRTPPAARSILAAVEPGEREALRDEDREVILAAVLHGIETLNAGSLHAGSTTGCSTP